VAYCKVIGRELRRAREEALLSQQDVAAVSGIPKARLSRYENGHVLPDIVSLSLIAGAFDLVASDILFNADL
jgi:transcriptional regulator with XRE-family HTH domain